MDSSLVVVVLLYNTLPVYSCSIILVDLLNILLTWCWTWWGSSSCDDGPIILHSASFRNVSASKTYIHHIHSFIHSFLPSLQSRIIIHHPSSSPSAHHSFHFFSCFSFSFFLSFFLFFPFSLFIYLILCSRKRTRCRTIGSNLTKASLCWVLVTFLRVV